MKRERLGYTPVGVNKGLEFLREQREKIGAGSGDRYWNLWIKPGDRAQFWFLTDGPDLAVVLMHVVDVVGRGGKSFSKDVLCARASIEDETHCDLCETDRPMLRVISYVYVTQIIHARRDPKAKNSDQWEPFRAGESGVTRFREKVNAVRLLAARRELASLISDEFNGDPLAEDYGTRKGTLLDRPFALKRADEEKSRESIEAGAPREMPDEVKAAMADLPPLEDTIQRQYTITPSGGNGQRSRPKVDLSGDGRASTGFDDEGFEPGASSGSAGFAAGDDELEDLPF